MVILEMGCGNNVPSVRMESRELLEGIGQQCTLIRINLDFPLSRSTSTGGKVISILGKSLEALQEINKYLKELSSTSSSSSSSNL